MERLLIDIQHLSPLKKKIIIIGSCCPGRKLNFPTLHLSTSSMFLILGRKLVLYLSDAWYLDVMSGGSAAILKCKVTLRTESR